MPKKLGVKEGDIVCVVGDPGNARELIEPLPLGLRLGTTVPPPRSSCCSSPDVSCSSSRYVYNVRTGRLEEVEAATTAGRAT